MMNRQIPLRTRVRLFARNWVYLFWLALIPLMVSLLPDDRVRNCAYGVAKAQTETLVALENVRITSCLVQPGDAVKKGQLLMTMQGSGAESDLANLKLRFQALMESSRKTVLDLETKRDDARERLKDIDVKLAEVQLDQQRDQATYQAYEEELSKLQPLVNNKLIPETELSRLRPLKKEVEITLAHYPALLDKLTQQRAQTVALIATLDAKLTTEKTHAKTVLAPHESALLASESLQQNDGIKSLRASFDGVISHVQVAAGDTVEGGAPLIRITAPKVSSVTVYLLPYQIADVQANTAVTLLPRHRLSAVAYPATIARIEPEMLDLADPFNPVPSYPTRGLKAYISVSVDNDLIPGEAISIELPKQSLSKQIKQWWGKIQMQAGH